MKRALAILLCIVLLITALPGAAYAETEELSKEEAVIKEARRVYDYSLSTAQKESFAGFCGLMTSHQLWHMGINDWLETYDGNKQFDAYAAKEQTTGGYYITAYPADSYTLEQALNAITEKGTKDAYNLLVGFQWTNTEAGAIYGHACVINAILDGTVYFVESFPTSIGGAEGNVIQCSIQEFAKFFDDWTVFDGVIDFGTGLFTDSCQFYGTDVFLRTRFGSNLRSQPCLLGENDCVRLRSVAAGELLRATAVCKNRLGETYYRVEDGERTGYVIANAVSVVRVNGEGLSLADVSIPQTLPSGGLLSLAGAVVTTGSDVSALEVQVIDGAGNTALQCSLDVEGSDPSLQRLNELLSLYKLGDGAYQLEIYATASNVVAKGAGLGTQYVRTRLLKQSLVVGQSSGPQLESAQVAMAQITENDGWVWENGTWYCYDRGTPRSGWIRELGVDYYLNPDGSVTTGWAEIDGIKRCFSATGALCTGWLTVAEGVTYRGSDGAAVTGLVNIGGAQYYFDDSGLLVTEGTVTLDDVTYTIQADGTAQQAENKK